MNSCISETFQHLVNYRGPTCLQSLHQSNALRFAAAAEEAAEEFEFRAIFVEDLQKNNFEFFSLNALGGLPDHWLPVVTVMGSNPCAGEDFLCGISVNVHSPNLTKRVCH